MNPPKLRAVGARPLEDRRWAFSVWATNLHEVQLEVEDNGKWERVELIAGANGYHDVVLSGLRGDERYRYVLDGMALADPASKLQPDGVHGPSQLFDPGAFSWSDEGFALESFEHWVIYECHIGSFTGKGNLEGATDELERLVELGVNAIELMPVAEFPGSANWGYDGVFPFAVQHTYGGPLAYQHFIDRCHDLGLAVVQDVVYNHFGPEGNVVTSYGPYLTKRYATPWGGALNFDDAYSDEVRNFFYCQARYLLEDLHVDALRLDAIHAILDKTARPFLAEFAELAHVLGEQRGRPVVLFAESADNDPAVLATPDRGGLSMDAQWNDDFHHSLHSLLTGEHDGYYADFGKNEQLQRAIAHGFVYEGEYSPYRGRRHGAKAQEEELARYVVYCQNHDQIGNRARGERLITIAGKQRARLAAGVTLCSSGTPLLFMGEEYGEKAPFAYFVDHSDVGLLEAVRAGREEEFGEANIFDPGAKSTFAAAMLQRDRLDEIDVASFESLYRELIALRHERIAVPIGAHREVMAAFDGPVLEVIYETDEVTVCLFNFSEHNARPTLPSPSQAYEKLLDSEEPLLGGNGALSAMFAKAGDEVLLCPYGFCVYGATGRTS